MKKFHFYFAITLLFLTSAWSSDRFSISSDIGLPFRLIQDGKGDSARENIYLGVEGRHWFQPNTNWGVRFQIDLDRFHSAYRKMEVGPSISQHWMIDEIVHPFFRLEVPVVLAGAANVHGTDSQFDVGVGGGIGVFWNIWNRSLFGSYDFGFHYFFGIENAQSQLSIELFRIGLTYLF